MKMDCYPRFKKSEIVKQCLIAEMEWKPLPIDPTPHEKATESQQFNGIWKKQRVRMTHTHCSVRNSSYVRRALTTLFICTVHEWLDYTQEPGHENSYT